MRGANGFYSRVRSLSIVLQDVEVLSGQGLSKSQVKELEDIVRSCRNVLETLEQTLDKYRELQLVPQGFGGKIRRVWKRVNWDPDDIRDLRSRIVTNITLLDAFQGQLIR